ncbi:ABC-type transport auxiliary lipoprotein family protein [Stella sp.]|uniref:ABC-type transport auxiliary lipoprotein family protein n=1 Tax=Stella sp. TaxID=2912054 RepID=UPI0035AFD3CD
MSSLVRRAPWAPVLLLAIAAACSSPLDKPPVEQRFYTLDAPRPEAAAAPADAPVLAVRRFRASPGYEGRELVFATGDGAFRTDFYNVFFAPPAAMIGDEAREWLDRSGLFRAAVASTSQADPHHALEGSLTAIHGDRAAGRHRAVLEVQFLLIDTRAANTPILFQRQYRRERPVADGTAAALAGGLNAALAEILGELEGDLAPVVRRPAPAPAQAPPAVRPSGGRAARR